MASCDKRRALAKLQIRNPVCRTHVIPYRWLHTPHEQFCSPVGNGVTPTKFNSTFQVRKGATEAPTLLYVIFHVRRKENIVVSL